MCVLANDGDAGGFLEGESIVHILEEHGRCTCDFAAEAGVIGLDVDVEVDLLIAFVGLRMDVAEGFRGPRVEVRGYSGCISADLVSVSGGKVVVV